ncbi:hypothetical protein [Roseibium sediminis]|uniref:hypothetical protein n=1 Tax=Roseibium sediminis TaxID=1775174 RepID=UPI00123DE8D8|nr:hypothetical protein [Roseibium sediminis]
MVSITYETAVSTPRGSYQLRFWESPYERHAPPWVDLVDLATTLIRPAEISKAVRAHAGSPVVQHGRTFPAKPEDLYLVSLAESFAFAERAVSCSFLATLPSLLWMDIACCALKHFMAGIGGTVEMVLEDWEEELGRTRVKLRLGDDLDLCEQARFNLINCVQATTDR